MEDEELLFLCKQLTSLLEQDSAELSHCLRGEVLEKYRALISEEARKIECIEFRLRQFF